ncbi:MAG: TerB family tellurite resistance protein [Desulfobulbaceae bacterium]|nr:TerB family tellurite resistance protein [Desulfobulbaceae bacterium]
MLAVIRNIIEGKSGKGKESIEDLEQKKHVAAGVLLLEAAHIDNECTAEEMEHIVATLRAKFDLSDNCVAELLELAHNGREEAIDLWQFTNHVNRHFSPAEKLAVMEDVWRIVFLDGQLEKHEDHYAHKLANLLRLSHKQMIDAKLRARDQMAG